MLVDGTFEFKLRRPIEVHGASSHVDTLTFHECGEGYDDYYMKLRKHMVSAQLKSRQLVKDMQEDQEKDQLESGEEVKNLHEIDDDEHMTEAEGIAAIFKIALGNSDELAELVKVFGFMVKYSGGSAICTANGERVKEGAWNRLHIEDKIDAAVKYCAFFGIGLDKALSNASGIVSDSHTDRKVL